MRRRRLIAGGTRAAAWSRVAECIPWLTTPVVTRAGGIAVTFAVTAILACFSLKEPPCAFSCADPPHLCPADYTCGPDDLCHRTGTTALCAMDAGPDVGDSTDSADGGAGGTGGTGDAN